MRIAHGGWRTPILHRSCTENSNLVAILEELTNKTGGDLQPQVVTNDFAPLPPEKVTVLDGMAVFQAMGKPP